MNRGFTLIETLIALVIASITALVLLQSISAIGRASAGVDRAAATALTRGFTTQAVQDAISASLADYLDSDTVFRGDSQHLEGATRRPVLDTHGPAKAYSLNLRSEPDGTTVLIYTESGQSIRLMQFTDTSVRFQYTYRSVTTMYAEQPPVSSLQWPPEGGIDPDYEYFRPPPSLIQVVTDRNDPVFAVHIAGWGIPPLRTRDVEEVL